MRLEAALVQYENGEGWRLPWYSMGVKEVGGCLGTVQEWRRLEAPLVQCESGGGGRLHWYSMRVEEVGGGLVTV